MQRTHSRPALVGPALLIAVLAAVLFSASPVNAQSPTVRVYFEERAYTVAESDDPTTPERSGERGFGDGVAEQGPSAPGDHSH